MDIDVRKLKFSGKDCMDFSFDYTPEENLVLTPSAVIDGNIHVSATLELHGDDVYVDGVVNCAIVGECARCLKRAEYNLTSEFSVVYAIERQDEDDYLYHSGLLDLKLAVDDVLLINFPTVIYCKEECKGLCPICGKDLNESSCDCKK
jgi:uncharacterized protein